MSRLVVFVLGLLVSACADTGVGGGDDSACGALPGDACTRAECDAEPGSDRYGACAGRAVYACVDGEWVGQRCDPPLLQVDGVWDLTYDGAVLASCVAPDLPASLEITAVHPPGLGRQALELSPTDPDATFTTEEVQFVIRFDEATAGFLMQGTWPGAVGPVEIFLDHDLDFVWDGTIAGTATGFVPGAGCNLELTVTGRFSPSFSSF